MRRKKWWWAVRGTNSDFVMLFKTKPKMYKCKCGCEEQNWFLGDVSDTYPGCGSTFEFCQSEWFRVTGFKLEEDKPVQVTFEVTAK